MWVSVPANERQRSPVVPLPASLCVNPFALATDLELNCVDYRDEKQQEYSLGERNPPYYKGADPSPELNTKTENYRRLLRGSRELWIQE